jgi:hypothetical protein
MIGPGGLLLVISTFLQSASFQFYQWGQKKSKQLNLDVRNFFVQGHILCPGGNRLSYKNLISTPQGLIHYWVIKPHQKISITPKVRKIPPQDPVPTQSWWVLNPASGEFSPVLSEITFEYQLGWYPSQQPTHRIWKVWDFRACCMLLFLSFF